MKLPRSSRLRRPGPIRFGHGIFYELAANPCSLLAQLNGGDNLIGLLASVLGERLEFDVDEPHTVCKVRKLFQGKFHRLILGDRASGDNRAGSRFWQSG